MNILLSVPTGFHARELLAPLKELLERDADINKVYCLTPAAPYRQVIFPGYSAKFVFLPNPSGRTEHEKLMRRINPNVVVTNTSGLEVKDTPILQAARACQVNTITFISSWDNVWKMERFKNKGKTQVIADHLIVWNNMMRQHLQRLFPSLQPGQVSVIGAPRLDFFTHQDRIPSQKQLLAYLGLSDSGAKLIHFATTELYPLEYIIKTIVLAQQKGAIKHQLHLYASVHPGGDISKHKQYADKYHVTARYSFGRHESSPHPDFQYNPSREEIYMHVALFKHSDLLINHSSTVAVESFFGDTPVINVKYGQPWDWWRWYRSHVYHDFKEHYRDITTGGATKLVANSRQLVAAVNAYLSSPELDKPARQATLKKIITTTDGTASHEVLKKIKQIAQK